MLLVIDMWELRLIMLTGKLMRQNSVSSCLIGGGAVFAYTTLRGEGLHGCEASIFMIYYIIMCLVV